MSWTIKELQHNASVLYNHLFPHDADSVYIDAKGHLQVDNRSLVLRMAFPLGNTSRKATDAVAIKTLSGVFNALEDGSLNSRQITIQQRNPIGLFMDEEDEGTCSLTGLLEMAAAPNAPFASTNRPLPNEKWLSREKFGMNICNAARFNVDERKSWNGY